MRGVSYRLPYDGSEKEEGEAARAPQVPDEIDLRKGATLESLTQQSFAEAADLNIVMKRMGYDEDSLPEAPVDPRYYGDTTLYPTDLGEVLRIGREATDHFMALPAWLREKFHNDPIELHKFVHDPANLDESVKLGLLKRKEPLARRGSDAPPRRRRADAEEDARELAEMRRRRNDPAPLTGAPTSGVSPLPRSAV